MLAEPKMDLVMWTYNSVKSLNECLASIDNAIPETNICHKIAVDGGSTDGTLSILKRYGWIAHEPDKRGIPYQANYALNLTDTKFFAAFEHDIILNPHWFDSVSKLMLSNETIGAVQGIRLFVGSKTMRAIDEWLYKTQRIPIWTFSIDNTLFRTDAVKSAGGFSDECMASTDAIMRRNMFELGYKWITDHSLISGHYRRDFFEQFRHQLKSLELARYYWWASRPESSIPRGFIATLGGNPVHVLNMTIQSRMLRVPFAWYILRLQRGMYLNLPHEDKIVKPIAMDDWYLRKFRTVVLSSRDTRHSPSKSPSQNHGIEQKTCAWCGQKTSFAYRVPRDWGNILPKLHPGIHQTFYACSDIHAGEIADSIFKHSFDYVIPRGGRAAASPRRSELTMN